MSSPPDTDPEASQSDPWPIPGLPGLSLGLLSQLIELHTLTWSCPPLGSDEGLPCTSSPTIVCGFTTSPLCFVECVLVVVISEDDRDRLQFDSITVEDVWELSALEPSPSDRREETGLTDESTDVRLLLLTARTLPPWRPRPPRGRPPQRLIWMTSTEAGSTALGMILDK